jgi:uncharacterized protein YggE
MEANELSSKLILSICLAALALCIAASAQESTLRVTGTGSVQVPADTTIIAFYVQNSSHNFTAAERSASLMLNQTEEALIGAGVSKEEIGPHRYRGRIKSHEMICTTVNNTTDCRDVTVNAATMRMVVRLKSMDANQTQKVIDAAEAAGARAAIRGYELRNASKALEQARKKALENAKAKAEYYASRYDLSLGKSIEIEEPDYPDIEMGPSYGWDRPRGMGRMHWMHWMSPFSQKDSFWGDGYIPEGMAEVTAYVRVAYQVQSR